MATVREAWSRFCSSSYLEKSGDAVEDQLLDLLRRNAGADDVGVVVDTDLAEPEEGVLHLGGARGGQLAAPPPAAAPLSHEPLKPVQLRPQGLLDNVKREVVADEEGVIDGCGAGHGEVGAGGGVLGCGGVEIRRRRGKGEGSGEEVNYEAAVGVAAGGTA